MDKYTIEPYVYPQKFLVMWVNRFNVRNETEYIKVSENEGYSLRYPLRCKYEDVNGIHKIESEILKISVTANSIDEAETKLALAFNDLYEKVFGTEELSLEEISFQRHLEMIVERIDK